MPDRSTLTAGFRTTWSYDPQTGQRSGGKIGPGLTLQAAIANSPSVAGLSSHHTLPALAKSTTSLVKTPVLLDSAGYPRSRYGVSGREAGKAGVRVSGGGVRDACMRVHLWFLLTRNPFPDIPGPAPLFPRFSFLGKENFQKQSQFVLCLQRGHPKTNPIKPNFWLSKGPANPNARPEA